MEIFNRVSIYSQCSSPISLRSIKQISDPEELWPSLPLVDGIFSEWKCFPKEFDSYCSLLIEIIYMAEQLEPGKKLQFEIKVGIF